MDVLSQNLSTGLISLTDNGFALINELFRTLTFFAGVFIFLFVFYILFKIFSTK